MSGDAEADDPAEPDHPTPAPAPADGPGTPAGAGEPAEADAPGGTAEPDEPAEAAAPAATAQAAHDEPAEAAGPTAAAEPDVPVGPGQAAAEPAKPAAVTVPEASDEAPTQPDTPTEADGTDQPAPTGPAGADASGEPAEAAEPAEPVDEPAQPDTAAHSGAGAPSGADELAEATEPTAAAAPDAPDAPDEAAEPAASGGSGEPDEAAGPTEAAEPAGPTDKAPEPAKANQPAPVSAAGADAPAEPAEAVAKAPEPAGTDQPAKPAAATVPEASDEAPTQPDTPTEADGTDQRAPTGAAGADAPAEPTEAAEPAGPTDKAPGPAETNQPAPLSAAEADAPAEPTEAVDEAAEPAGPTDKAPEPAGAATGRPGRSLLVHWLLPVALAATTAASALGAITLNADEASSAVGDRGAAATPLLSARRAPEVLAEPVAARRLTADLQGWLAQSPPDTCLVVDDAGQHVFEHNPTTPLAGASTQKLLTSTALLLALGADATLETTAVAADAPARGVIDGHLYMVGGGDALLATRSWRDHFRRQPRTIADIEQLAQAVVDAGVTRITGSVIGDASRYESQTYHPAWPRRFFDDREIGPIGGLMVNDGFASFPSAATPGAPTLPSTNVGADAANILTLALRVRGVEVVGPPRSGAAPEDAAEVATMPSLPIRDIVAEMLTDSDNETAEAALKEVGHAESGEGSWAAGAAAATELLSGAGVTMDGVEVVDGSGLSVRNQLTCTTLVDVLTSPGTGQVVREGLAVAGETGTLATRWDGTPADGRLRAKTGTLRNVTALAGEIDVADGDTVTFAYVANVPDPGQISSDQVGLTGLADLLMRYPEGVDLAALQPAAATQPGTPPAG